MTKTIEAMEFYGQDSQRLHRITVPEYNEPKWYITTISCDAFSTREMKRIHPYNEKLGHCVHVKNWKTMRRYVVKFCRDRHECFDMKYHPGMEIVTHESIWAFYKYIGYDYKKKKYI